ncbi:MAG: hypothetical protein ABI927_05750 [Gaiellaceae bacterium]
MGKPTIALALAAAGVAMIVVLFGGVFATSAGGGNRFGAIAAQERASYAKQTALASLVAGLSNGHTERYVRGLERRVAAHPVEGDTLALLALAYQQRARETGDPTYYALSDKALQRASAVSGPPGLVLQARATLANTRHRFADGLALARRALGADPESGSAYGPLGDALLNLGRYREAFRAYDRMAVLAPGVGSFTRVANARELLGRPAAAAQADELALSTATTIPEHAAWTRVQLGNIAFNQGRLAAAAKNYRAALAGYPRYVHGEAGLARVEASQGHYSRAIVRLRHVVEVLPIPAYVIMLGDILHASGRDVAAQRQYALVAVIEKLFAANGVRTELQTAVFDLDHGRHVADALARARTAFASAPGIYAEDALAWGLFRTGRCDGARSHSIHALRLGTRDALLMFHRAMIEHCLGAPSAQTWFRRALATNPHFSFLWAPVARRAVAAGS